MEENEASSSLRPSSSSSSLRPTIALPPRSSMESLFAGGPGAASPGPMTLVSNFFSENDPDSDCRSFSQLLAGAMNSPAAVSGYRPSFPPADDSSSNGRDAGGGGDFDFRFNNNNNNNNNNHRPSGLIVSQPSTFTIPPGLSPATLLDSPGFFPPGQGPFQQVLAQVTAQANASLPQVPYVTSNTTAHQQMPRHSMMQESSDLSHSDQRSQPSAFTVDKPSDDGYNWRKYGQKQVKGSEYPRSYYKCTHANCPVKKKVERSVDGQVTEIIYKGQHNHQRPQPSKRGKDTGNPNETLNPQGNSELGFEGQNGNFNKFKDGVQAYSLSMKDQESSQATPDNLGGSSDSEEVGDAETGVDERDEDEPEAKRRNAEVRVSELASSSHRTVTEPRIIVQTTSEVDLLDDGYRWRKYGQKVVKGNPYPRSYYKCTSQGCNVRKHVERAPSDRKAVITTYEGKHNHDVPAAKNSSHNTASQLKPHNGAPDTHNQTRRLEFAGNDQQPRALLRFKEEHLS
ncbi:hypothetical protein LguiA_000409 [Lonicera macranthoides]